MFVLRVLALVGAVSLAICGPAAAGDKKTFEYACAGNQTITVTYDGDKTAIVSYLGSTYKMKRAVSADGARYVGKGMQWWSKGNGGFLAGASPSHVIAGDCVAKK